MRGETPLVLTLDIGSSSTRAMVYDARGRAVPGLSAQEQSDLRTAANGLSEEDADAACARAGRCIDLVLAKAGTLAVEIGGVAVDTYVSNLLAVDASGRPLTPIITYADTRNAPDAEGLQRRLDERTVHERTGCLLRTSYWPARLAWLHRTQPDLWRRAARWLTLGEYLELRLFGRCRVTYSVAAWSGLLDRVSLRWDAPLLEQLEVPVDQLSTLVDVDAPLIGLAQPYAARWPALQNVPWLPAMGDGAAANVGSGCVNLSRVALTLGTTGAMRVARPEVQSMPPGLWCYRIDRNLALLGGATSEGGNVFAWLRETLRLSDSESVEAALAACEPDGHGLTVLPFVAGERSPDWAGNVQATLHGITLATKPIAIVRACLEAVAYRFALIAGRLAGQACEGQRIVASGSALRNSPAWSQVFADVLGRPVVLSAEPQATSRGVALMALRAIGTIPSVDALPAAEGATYEPDAGRHAVYKAAIARQQRLYDQLVRSKA